MTGTTDTGMKILVQKDADPGGHEECDPAARWSIIVEANGEEVWKNNEKHSSLQDAVIAFGQSIVDGESAAGLTSDGTFSDIIDRLMTTSDNDDEIDQPMDPSQDRDEPLPAGEEASSRWQKMSSEFDK